MANSDRHSRQIRFSPIGEEGQRRLSQSSVAILGVGALGTVAADLLVRAGIGRIRLVDRDFVEISNLQRQALFDEDDARLSLPKAVAAERHLKRIDSRVEIDARIDDVNPETVSDLIDGVDLVLDGLDNFETRFVLNDACARADRPWIYTAAVGSYGVVMPVLPGRTACLRCVMAEMPAPGSSPTCETAGVIGPVTHAMAALQCSLALRHLTGQLTPQDVRLVSLDVWSLRWQSLRIDEESRETCPVCADRRFDYLDTPPLRTITMCGRNAVQLIPAGSPAIDLAVLAGKMATQGQVQSNEFLVRCFAGPFEITVFRDGRSVIKGTEDPAAAKSVYAKFVGT